MLTDVKTINQINKRLILKDENPGDKIPGVKLCI